VKPDQSNAMAASSEHGFVIVAVLWILLALSMLAIIFSTYLSGSARALSANDTALQAEALVSASLELTTYQLLLADDNARPSHGSFHFRMDDADIVVAFKSEAARIDLNFASNEVLANLFTVLGAGKAAALEDANRIIGWRTRPVGGAPNAEESLYAAAGLGYSPRQSLFTHVDELALVVSLPPALVERALPFLTVFNGSSGVDSQIATPEVIAALSGKTPAGPDDALGQRPSLSNDTPASAAASPGSTQGNATAAKSASYRIEATVNFNNGRRTASEVVITLGDEAEPYRVLSWQDDVEARATSRKRTGL
jgi:general secretion pathway protein K